MENRATQTNKEEEGGWGKRGGLSAVTVVNQGVIGDQGELWLKADGLNCGVATQTEGEKGAGVKKIVWVPSAVTAVDQGVSYDSWELASIPAALPPKQRRTEKKAGAKNPVWVPHIKI